MRSNEKQTTENARKWETAYWEYALAFRSTEISATNSVLTAANRVASLNFIESII